MTDENARPGSGPPRESELNRPDDRVVDDVAEDAEQAVAGTGEAEIPVAAGPTVEAVENSEPVVLEGDAEAAPGDASEAAPEASIASASETDADAVVEPIDETPGDVEAAPASDAGEGTDGAAMAVDTEPARDVGEVETAAETEAVEVAERASEPAAAEVAVPAAEPEPAEAARDDVFVWHPEHRGKSFDELRAALSADIAADQRQHRLAMDGAEESEQEALASVVSLERKWGPYDFDWAEQEPEELADRIVAFERERERRRELISWSDYRSGDAGAEAAQLAADRPAELSTSAKGLSLLLVVLLILVILLAVWAL